MKAMLVKLSHEREESHCNKALIERLHLLTEGSQSRRIVLLSLRKPNKIPEKIDIKSIFQQAKRPIFTFANRSEHRTHATTEFRGEDQNEQMFEYNIRNLISKSVPYVTPQPKEPTTTKKPNQKHFRISREVKSTHKVQMEKMKKGYISIHQQLGIIANLRERGCLENKEGIRSRKNKVTFYMNNFMKTKYSKAKKQSLGSECRRKRGLQESTEGSEIFPWKSFEGEEDGLMPG